MNLETASKELCRWAEKLSDLGVAGADTGCLSIRLSDQLVITPEDLPLTGLTPDRVAVVSLKNQTPVSGPKPDRRFPLHAAVYGKRKKISALINADSLSIMTASKAGKDVPPLLDDMAQIVGVSAKVATTWPFRGTRPVVSALKGRNAVLLKNAGALCGAGSLDDAMAVAQVLEKGCKAAIEATFLGGGVRIHPAEARLMRLVYLLKYSKQQSKNVK